VRIPYINAVSKNITYVVKTKPDKVVPPKNIDAINIPYVTPLSKKIVIVKSIIVK
jgi:hypothetical protein